MTEIRVRRELGRGASLERLRSITHDPRPASLREVLEHYIAPMTFEERLVTSDGVALGGHQSVTIDRDGTWSFSGAFRATGWPSYDVSLATHLVAEDGSVLVFAAHATVHGTNEPGDREVRFEQHGVNPIVAQTWPALRNATLRHDLQYDVDPFGTAGDILAFVAKAAVAVALGGIVGLVVVVSMELIDALDLQELALPGTVGLLIAGGALFVFGPAALIPALVAGFAGAVITADLVKQRRLTDEEYSFAEAVFGGTLPRERILLTNLTGVGERPFTMPAPGDAILVNLGAGYDDPIRYTGRGTDQTGIRAAGPLLVHELTHAWQITHTSFLPGLMCSGFLNQLGTLGGNMDVYKYGPAQQPWSEFNLEQQASIVDQWFSGKRAVGPGQQAQFEPMLHDEANPYWRYIRDNIRPGVV